MRGKVNVVEPGTLTSIRMVVHPGEHHEYAPESVARWYEIHGTGEAALFDLTLSYLDSELEGANEDSLAMWRWDGGAWEGPKETIAHSTTANWLTAGGQTSFSDWVMAENIDVTGIPGAGAPATSFELVAGSPNPFTAGTRIGYRLARAEHATLTVYDVAGRVIRVLADRDHAAGEYLAVWDGRTRDGREAPAGLYFCELRAGAVRQARNLVLQK